MPRPPAHPRPSSARTRPPRLRHALQRRKTSPRTRPETARLDDPPTHRSGRDTAPTPAPPPRPTGPTDPRIRTRRSKPPECSHPPAALAAVPGRVAGVGQLVARLAQRGLGGLNQSPAQVVGPVFPQRAAPVALTRLVDSGAKAGVADELCRRRETTNIAELAG